MDKTQKSVKKVLEDLPKGGKADFPIDRVFYLASLCSTLGAAMGRRYSQKRMRSEGVVRVTRVE